MQEESRSKPGAIIAPAGPPHSRKQFQVDRIAFLSDAIMAIAMTLLILEFKVPPLGKNTTWSQFLDRDLDKLRLPALALLLTFFNVGNLWAIHHRLFEHVVNYNSRLIRSNLGFLFFIMILPLSTSFMLEPDNPAFLRFFFYLTNLGLCNLFFSLLRSTVLNPKNKLGSSGAEQAMPKGRLVLVMIALFGAAILSLFSPNYFGLPFLVLLIPVVQRMYLRLISARSRKKAAISPNYSRGPDV